MGFFSWVTSDTHKPVRNRWTDDGPTPCKMLDEQGREWIERNYDGYGVFGGMDYYELLDKMNDGRGSRDKGIKRDFSGDPDVIRPKIVSIDCKLAWEDLPDSPIADCQGFF